MKKPSFSIFTILGTVGYLVLALLTALALSACIGGGSGVGTLGENRDRQTPPKQEIKTTAPDIGININLPNTATATPPATATTAPPPPTAPSIGINTNTPKPIETKYVTHTVTGAANLTATATINTTATVSTDVTTTIQVSSSLTLTTTVTVRRTSSAGTAVWNTVVVTSERISSMTATTTSTVNITGTLSTRAESRATVSVATATVAGSTIVMTSTVNNFVTTTASATITLQHGQKAPGSASVVQTITSDITTSVHQPAVTSAAGTRVFVASVRIITLADAPAQTGGGGFLSMDGDIPRSSPMAADAVRPAPSTAAAVSVRTITLTMTIHPTATVTTRQTVAVQTVVNTLTATLTSYKGHTVGVRQILYRWTNIVYNTVTKIIHPRVEVATTTTVHVQTITASTTTTITTHYTKTTTARETARKTVDIPATVTNDVYLSIARRMHTITSTAGVTLHLFPDGMPASVALPPPGWSGAPAAADAEYTASPGLEKINALPAYDPRNNHLGQGVTIAMIGGSVLASHAELTANLVAGTSFAGTPDPAPNEESDNTRAALVIAAAKDGKGMHGVAPSAKILPLQIINGTVTVDALRALRHAAGKDIPIVNHGLGLSETRAVEHPRYRPPYSPQDYALKFPYIPEMMSLGIGSISFFRDYFKETREIVRGKDMVMVHPAGDGGWNRDNGWTRILAVDEDSSYAHIRPVPSQELAWYYGFTLNSKIEGKTIQLGSMFANMNFSDMVGLAPLYERDLLGKWVVAAATRDTDRIAGFSNGCGRAMHWCLAAPGYTTDSASTHSLTTGNSTANAAARVSGALAVMRSRFPSLPMNALLAILFKTATDLGDAGVDDVYGHGMLNLGAAITAQGEINLVVDGARERAGSFAQAKPGHAVLAPPNESAGIDHGTAEYRWNAGLSVINAHIAHDHGYYGQGATIGLVGYGLDSTGEFDDNNILGHNLVFPHVRAHDIGSAGRQLAGFLFAAQNGHHMVGVAPQAKVMALQTASNYRRRNVPLKTVDERLAFRYAASRDVHILFNTAKYSQEIRRIDPFLSIQLSATLPVMPKLLSIGVGSESFYRDYFSDVRDMFDGRDMVMVWGTGDEGWNSESGIVAMHNIANSDDYSKRARHFIEDNSWISVRGGANHTIASLSLSANEPGIMGYAPLYEEDLRGKWVMAVAVHNEGSAIASFSNGCGKAMYWCLAAPGGDNLKTIGHSAGGSAYHPVYRKGTDIAAAHVSGALAVLRSRYPNLPMSAVLAIMLKTATDLGAPGVDEVYGHGLLNLAAAISLRGSFNLVIDDSSVTGISVKSRAATPPPQHADILSDATLYVDSDGMPARIMLPDHVKWRGEADMANEYSPNYGLSAINAGVAHLYGYKGQGVTIALIGGGVPGRHAILAHKVIQRDFYSYLLPPSQDIGGHGDGIAGVIAGDGNQLGAVGVAPQAKLVVHQISGESRQGDAVVEKALAAFNNAAAEKAPIVLFWKPGSEILYTNDAGYNVMTRVGVPLRPISREFFSLVNKRVRYNEDDMAVVTPAGDGGWNTETGSVSPLTAAVAAGGRAEVYKISTSVTTINQPDLIGLAPLYEENLLGNWVVAAAADEGGRIAESSNGCGDAMHWCLVAPGKNIYTAGTPTANSYSFRDGSLYAAALVSGALAVLRSRFPAVPMKALVAIMLKTATDKGAAGVDRVYGHGMLNLGAAITVQGSMDLSIPDAKAVAGSGRLQPHNVDEHGNTLFLILPEARPLLEHGHDNIEYRNNRGLWAIGALGAYRKAYFGQGVTIGLMGSGWLVNHTELTLNSIQGTNFVDGNADIYDANLRGTPIAGIVAAEKNHQHMHGLAPKSKIMPLQILGSVDMAHTTVLSLSRRALRHAVGSEIPIINNGFGFSRALTISIKGAMTTQYLIPSYPVGSAVFDLGVESEATYREHFAKVRDIVRGKDVVMVWDAGDGGWNGETRGGWHSGEGQIQLLSLGGNHKSTLSVAHLTTHYELIASDGTGRDLTILSPENGENQPDIMGLAPLYEEELLGKWVVAVATEYTVDIKAFSNGCGRAMHWCIAAPGEHLIYTTTSDGGHAEDRGTDIAAAHVSGALAVMRSRFPGMPMSAILAILFKTADDRGAPGVDPVYGQGMLNLWQATRVQGYLNIDMPEARAAAGSLADAANTAPEAPSTSTGVSGLRLLDLSDTHFAVGFAGLAREMSNLSVAVSYLGEAYYYDAALTSLTEFQRGAQPALGNAAADMFAAPHHIETPWGLSAVADHRTGKIRRAGIVRDDWRLEYDICTDCTPASWQMDAANSIGNAHFAENQQGLGALWSPWSPGAEGAPGVALFSELGLGDDGGRETYRQYGLRWEDDLTPSFSWLAEASEIHEDNALLGSRGDILGLDSSKSRQVRLGLSGEVGGWQWQGGLTQGWTDVALDGTGLVAEASGIRYRQWQMEAMTRSLLGGGDEFRLGVAATPQVRGNLRVDYYRADNEVFVEDFQYSLPTGVTAESMTLTTLSDDSLIWRAGYKWRVLHLQEMWAAMGLESVRGGAMDGDYQATFDLRWGF